MDTPICQQLVPCAGVAGPDGKLLVVSMPCQLDAHDGDQHEVRLATDEYEVTVTAVHRRSHAASPPG